MNSREHYVKSNRYNKIPDHGILVGDLVLVKDHTAKSFAPKYKEDFRVVQIYGTNALQVSDKQGKLHNVHITDIRKINMTEKVTTQLKEVYDKGRSAKNLIPQGRIPDLGWNMDQQGKERMTRIPCHSCTCYRSKIHVSPLSSQKACVLANYVKFANHFLICSTRNGNLKFCCKLHKIHPIHQSLQRIT